MLRVVAVSVETNAAPEACLATELVLRRIFDKCDEAVMNGIALLKDLRQRKALLFFRC